MKPYSLILLIALIPLLMCKWSLSNAERFREAPKPSINDSILYLKGSVPPYTIEVKVLGSIMTTPEVRELIKCESGGDINAINTKDIHYLSSGETERGSYGILQYSPATFQEYCVEKYGLRNDLFDPLIQIKCAERMISENLGHRWGCWDK